MDIVTDLVIESFDGKDKLIPDSIGQFICVDVALPTNLSLLDLTTNELAEMRSSVSQKPDGSVPNSATFSLLNPKKDVDIVTDLVIESFDGKDKPHIASSKKTKKKKRKDNFNS